MDEKASLKAASWVGWTEVCSQEHISLITNSFLIISIFNIPIPA